MELISIIIPVYNCENYIDRCLISVLNQTYDNIEIILINDGSTDNSGTICDEFAERSSKIRVIHQENKGQSNARNTGLDNAKGDYIAFVDADDWISMDMMDYLHQLINRHNVDASFCDFAMVKNNKPFLDKQQESVSVLDKKQLMNLFYRINGEKNSYAVWRGLYKSNLLKEIRFREGIITEDVLFTYEVYSRCERVVMSNAIKYFYFINKTGITNSPLCKKDLIIFDIWDEIASRVSDDEVQYAELNKTRSVFSLYVKSMLKGKTDEIEDETISIWKKILTENYEMLRKTKILDWKRKIMLWYIVKFD